MIQQLSDYDMKARQQEMSQNTAVEESDEARDASEIRTSKEERKPGNAR